APMLTLLTPFRTIHVSGVNISHPAAPVTLASEGRGAMEDGIRVQTILGANGQIAVELARELNRAYLTDLRLVSRRPRAVNETDTMMSADLLDAAQTTAAVAGSSVV